MATKQLLMPNSDVAITIPLKHLDSVGGAGCANDDPADNYLPTNVDDETQLDGLPDACRSFTNPARPLRHVDLHGIESTYVLRPLRTVVWLILIVEAMERFAYYGVYYTQTLYLTGVYNENWNAGLSSIEAASYVSLSTAVAYSTPFLGAYLADAILGDYWTIALAGTTLYLPGLALMALTSVPHLLGSSSFNRTALGLALFVLWPAGAGSIKSCVNIFGARRTFPPLLWLISTS
jgi:proton-dependent oligopeptide transporter, POT family